MSLRQCMHFAIGCLIIICSERNLSGPFDSSVSAITYLTATDVIGNKTLQSQWLQELDEQFNATNPTEGQRKKYQIARARLLPDTQEASIE